MAEIWLISDTHFNHGNILKFKSTWLEGRRVRPEFEEDDVDGMNELMLDNWAKLVKPKDKVYHLGDLGSDKEWLVENIRKLPGHKRLLLGNHDQYPMWVYEQIFEKVLVSRKLEGVLLTHYPVVTDPHEINVKANIHGHTHEFVLDSKKHLNVCVEQTQYAPINYEDVLIKLRARGLVE